LTAQALNGGVSYIIDERGLVIGLVADDLFFTPGSAELTTGARAVLSAAAPVIAALPEQLSIEGHANHLPVSAGRYATNWELSSDRATQVLRALVEAGGVPAARVRAVGYGDARPIPAATEQETLNTNRRVDLVILSGAPEAVRQLIPSITAGG
jgi:chemotaxis protein MotB